MKYFRYPVILFLIFCSQIWATWLRLYEPTVLFPLYIQLGLFLMYGLTQLTGFLKVMSYLDHTFMYMCECKNIHVYVCVSVKTPKCMYIQLSLF